MAPFADCDLRHVSFVAAEPPLRRAWGEPLELSPQRGRRSAGLSPWERGLRRLPDAEEGLVLDPFLGWLLQQACLEVSLYRAEALQRRLPACLRALRVSSPEAGQQLLERQPELLPKALSALLIGVSGFFRDPQIFEHLRQRVLPELLEGRSGLRVYSAGCSDGQELYSVAMLLDQMARLSASYLLGVDCRPEAVAHAAAGVFGLPDLAGVPPEWRCDYFQITGSAATVNPSLRQALCWRLGNLLSPVPTDVPFDLILFRNVAIYLNPERPGVWERLVAQLRPGGVLVTGKAERPPSHLSLRRLSPCLYRKSP